MSRLSASTPTLAVIGCGAIADSLHVPALARHPEIRDRIVLVDPSEERARALGERHGVRQTTRDHRDVLERIDGAIVAAPPRLHHPITLACLEAGIPVLCEKPLCEEPGRARSLVEASQRSGAALAVNQTRRLFPAHREVRERLAARELGMLQRIEYVLGEPYEWPAVSDSQFGTKSGGRGVLLDTGAHIVDLVCWWLGGAPELLDYRDDALGGSEAVADLELARGGCRAHVRLSWLSKLQNGYRIEGEAGAFEGGIYEWSSFTHRRPGGASRKVRTADRVSRFKDIAHRLIDNFLDVVRGRSEPLVPGREVLSSIEIIAACYARRQRFDMPWHDACHQLAHG